VRRSMRRERRQRTRREWEQITGSRPVVRRVLEQREKRARWYSFHADISELHAALADEHWEKAEKLLERDDSELRQWD
jgi:hypothetical protein